MIKKDQKENKNNSDSWDFALLLIIWFLIYYIFFR